MSETVKLKYIGGRSFVKAYYNRKHYIFKKESDYICEVPIRLSKILLLSGRYGAAPIEKVVQAEEKDPLTVEEKDPLVCDICGFKAKSEFGIVAHKRRHKKKEKK